MNPLSVGLWLIEHWYYVAAVFVVIVAAAMWGGLVSVAMIVSALLKVVAAIVKFFSTPPDQIAEKLLWGFVAAVLAASIFYQVGKHDERLVWKKAEAQHAAAMERLRKDAADEALKRVAAAQDAEREKTAEAEQRINDYERKLAAAPSAGACALTDDDLVAAGVSDKPGNRTHLRRRSK